jgi:hypothetical protein
MSLRSTSTTMRALTGCPVCNVWQDADGTRCRLAPDDIVALQELKAHRLRAEEKT